MINFIYVLNQTQVPHASFDARPQRIKVIPPRSNNEIVDLNGRPVGAFGKPYAQLEWDYISFDAYLWWLAWFADDALSVDLTHVILPHSEGSSFVTWGGTSYTNHKQWSSGILWRITPAPDANFIVFNRNQKWYEGTVTVKISELTE